MQIGLLSLNRNRTNLADTRLCVISYAVNASILPNITVCSLLDQPLMVLVCRKAQLLRSTAASFYCFVLGYLLLIVANNIALLLMSTAIRSAGSAVLWIYSTLMLQYLVPNQLLGRIMALEMALFTVRLQVAVVTCYCHVIACHVTARLQHQVVKLAITSESNYSHGSRMIKCWIQRHCRGA